MIGQMACFDNPRIALDIFAAATVFKGAHSCIPNAARAA
jgi:hypothetical protein